MKRAECPARGCIPESIVDAEPSATDFPDPGHIGSLGGLVTNSAGIPGGWLIGAMAAVFASGAAGVLVFVPGWLRSIAMGFAGRTVGASIDAKSIGLMAVLLWSLIAMTLFLTVVVWITYWLHQRLWNANGTTALASTWPCNVLLVFAGAETTRAKMETVYVVQSVRILALMGPLPLTIGLYHEPTIAEPMAFGVDLAMAGVLAILCIFLSVHVHLVDSEMFLTALAVGILSGLDILHVTIPPVVNTFFQVVVGAFIGLGLARCGARLCERTRSVSCQRNFFRGCNNRNGFHPVVGSWLFNQGARSGIGPGRRRGDDTPDSRVRC